MSQKSSVLNQPKFVPLPLTPDSRRSGKKRIQNGPPQPTLPAIRRAVIKALSRKQVFERCPHCRMRIRIQAK